MVPVNSIGSGAQKIWIPVTKIYQETDSYDDTSARTQRSGRAKTAIGMAMMEYSFMESVAVAVNNTAVIRHIYNIIIKPILPVVFRLSVKIRVIRYSRKTHRAT